MPTLAAVPLFLASLALTLVAARLFARRLDRLGVRFGFPEALIGLLTALAADGPEISSALYALIRNAPDVTVGVLVGSNAFNLAAMLGISALARGVRVERGALALEGSVSAGITLLAAAVLLGWVVPPVAAGAAGCLLAPYLLLVLAGPALLGRAPGAGPLVRALARALAQRPVQRREPATVADPAHHLLALVVLDVALIIAGSVGMVQAALALGTNWQVSSAVLGVLVLAPLTSLPNAITGVRLGLADRGAALVGETFNSNTINLAAGVIVPALFIATPALTATAKLQLAWLGAMTLLCLALLARGGGMGRRGACALIGMYVLFAALELL